VRIVTARMILASMMKTAPPNRSINVNRRRSVAVTPHSSYSPLVKMLHSNNASRQSYRKRDGQQIQISDDVENKSDQYVSRRDSRLTQLARIRRDLPEMVERLAGTYDCESNRNVGRWENGIRQADAYLQVGDSIPACKMSAKDDFW
jgi:hypothetical protein